VPTRAVVAEWASDSVAVLLRVYAKAVSGRDDHAQHRVQALLDDEPGPRPAVPGA
jgi:phage portal protein BeeE